MAKKKTNYMGQADRLFSQFIRTRDGMCYRCGTTENLQCAHIISRSYKTIRTHPLNAIALCRSCHVYFTHRPLEWQDWIEERFPGIWQQMRDRALTYERVNWKARVTELKEELDRLERW